MSFLIVSATYLPTYLGRRLQNSSSSYPLSSFFVKSLTIDVLSMNLTLMLNFLEINHLLFSQLRHLQGCPAYNFLTIYFTQGDAI